MSEPTQHGTTPSGGRYHQSSGVSATNPGPSIILPAEPVLEAPGTVKLADGAEVEVKPFTEDRSVMSFTRSQLQRMSPETYAKHRDAIQQAQELGLIVDDTISPEDRQQRNQAMEAKTAEYRKLYAVKQARQAEDKTYSMLQAAKDTLEHAKQFEDSHGIAAAEARVNEAQATFNTATAELKSLQAEGNGAA